MTSLRRALLDYAGLPSLPKGSLGSDYDPASRSIPVTQPAPTPSPDRDKLRRDLSAVHKDNKLYFLICVAMIVILFAASLGITLANLNNPEIVRIVMAAFGISCAGLITWMIKLWREKSTAELLIILAINTDADTLKTVVAVLIKRL